MGLDKLGSKVVKQDDGGAANVQDQDLKQILLSALNELRVMNLVLQEMAGTEVEQRDLQVKDLD